MLQTSIRLKRKQIEQKGKCRDMIKVTFWYE